MKTLQRETRRASVKLHLSVALWGFTAILGRLITLPADQLVAWRMVIVMLVLVTLRRTWVGVLAMPRRSRLLCGGVGLLVAAHWYCFYTAIKIANASVAVACLGLTPIFAAFLEPLLTRQRLERSELLLGVLSVPGVVLIAGGVPLEMRAGLGVGLLATVLAATFTVINKRIAAVEDPFAVTGIEMAAGAVVLGLPAWWAGAAVPTPLDWVWLVVLAIACTLLPFVLWLGTLKHVSAFSALLLINLEPVYAVLLAAIVFQEYEQLTPRFYIGTALVLVTVLLQPRLRRIAAAP